MKIIQLVRRLCGIWDFHCPMCENWISAKRIIVYGEFNIVCKCGYVFLRVRKQREKEQK